MASKPDWDYWKKMGVISLAEATMLSFDKEPDDEYCHGNGIALSGNAFIADNEIVRRPSTPTSKRYDLAAAAIGQEEGLKKIKHSRTSIPKNMPCVKIAEYGAWALRNGINLPASFPIDQGQRTSYSATSVSIELPYDCKFLSNLAAIMWEHYGENGSKDPKQCNVADAIVEKDTRVNSRIAKSLAAWIAPTSPTRKE